MPESWKFCGPCAAIRHRRRPAPRII